MRPMYRPSNPVLAVLGLSIFAFAVLGSNATQAQSATNALPEFPGDAVVRYVPENSLPGTSVGEPVAATDDDNDPLTYSITGADADLFVIEGVTGQIQVGEGTALDYEFKTSYAVTVTTVDPSGANASIAATIRVIDMTLDTPYDRNNNEIIDRDEAIAAVADYFSGVISRDEVLRVIQLYFSPTPVPAEPRYIAVSSGSDTPAPFYTTGLPSVWGSNLFGQSTPPENEQFMAVSSSASTPARCVWTGLPSAGASKVMTCFLPSVLTMGLWCLPQRTSGSRRLAVAPSTHAASAGMELWSVGAPTILRIGGSRQRKKGSRLSASAIPIHAQFGQMGRRPVGGNT